MYPPPATSSRDFSAISSANSSSPSLGRATTNSNRSSRIVSKIKSAGSCAKFWKKKSSKREQPISDEEEYEKSSWRQQALAHLAVFDNPNPFLNVVWLY